MHWKVTVAINGRSTSEEALKNTIAASERFDAGQGEAVPALSGVKKGGIQHGQG